VDLDRHHVTCVQSASSHVSHPKEKNMAALKDMFPDIKEDELSSALAAEGNVIEMPLTTLCPSKRQTTLEKVS